MKNFIRFGYAIIPLDLAGSVYAVYRIRGRASWRKLLPYYALMLLLAVINIYLFSLPMMHRV
ncbi:hypothetical protein D3C75_980450 [compost metagenome]